MPPFQSGGGIDGPAIGELRPVIAHDAEGKIMDKFLWVDLAGAIYCKAGAENGFQLSRILSLLS
ncbi:MAG: hypothetical protein MZV64_34755 [Ignavibacteriales bacterium]|nr:hypothetical protein [Ignavibacteriales bacterium]